MAQLHLQAGWVPEHVRVEALEAAVRGCCEPVFDKPLKEISLGQVLMRLFQVSRRFGVQVQPQLVLLQKTLLNSWSAKMLAIRQVRIDYQAQQLLIKLALEPEWEAKFEPHSYGFRPGKTYMAPILAIKEAIRYGSKYVLSANLAQHFEHIDHEKLLSKINTFPKLRRQIRVEILS